MSCLGREFFARDTLTVARELLGQRLVRVLACPGCRARDGQRLSGQIVEVEAYIGEEDSACHAAAGRTPRTEVMYGPPGHAYVYFIYGMHHCLNVVTEEEGFPAAVLIRAIEPEEGLEVMQINRPGRPDAELTDGPAKLCQALRIDRRLNGLDLCNSDELFLEEGEPVSASKIVSTARVGVRGDEEALNAPWRFYVKS
ncbi:MAG: DNA-3-methyladenine glycosylase [Chloroflexota bacterium]|nr:DNA-3-methyladenine glycosylase [Chloroflexota bacterium]